MIRALLVLGLVLAPASAGASGIPRPLALTAAPARLVLPGSGSAAVRIRNPGAKRIAVDAALAGFALDLHGRPRIVARRGSRSAAGWLTLRPSHFTLEPHGSVRLVVTARPPRSAAPGDHDALVLLTSRPVAQGRVAVRLRLGVVVLVRTPGAVVRRLRLGPLRVVRRSGGRALELVVLNEGNVTERLLHVRGALWRSGHRLATLAAGARELRPQSRGLLDFRLSPATRGFVAARVVVPAEPGRPAIRRTYRIRL